MNQTTELDYLWQKLESRNKFNIYSEDDCRNDYYGYSYDIMRNYYQMYTIHSLLGDSINGQIIFDNSLKYKELHINNILNIYSNDILSNSYFASINRGIIVDGLAAFETSTTEVLKSLSGNKKYSRGNLHSNINELFYLLDSKYGRDKQVDVEFLDFFRKLRNALHSNWYYYGSNYTYTFLGREFQFVKCQIVSWQESEEVIPNLYFEMIGKLNEIFDEIAKACGENVLLHLECDE